MAEGFARALAPHAIAAFSAGSRPSGVVNPRAIAFMAERRIDIGAHVSKSLDDIPQDAPWDALVTMGCGDACPTVPARRRLDWALTDPKHLDDDGFRRVRDEIETRVGALLTELLPDGGTR